METKHTKGPWTVGRTMKSGVEVMGAPDPKDRFRFIPKLAMAVGHPDNQEADARLIAAAPDLLYACQMAMESNPTTLLQKNNLFDLLFSATNKATKGES